MCPAANPTLHALTSQIAEGAFDLAASEGLLLAAQEEKMQNKGLASRLKLVADWAGDGPWNTLDVIQASKCWLLSCFTP